MLVFHSERKHLPNTKPAVSLCFCFFLRGCFCSCCTTSIPFCTQQLGANGFFFFLPLKSDKGHPIPDTTQVVFFTPLNFLGRGCLWCQSTATFNNGAIFTELQLTACLLRSLLSALIYWTVI